MAKAKCYVKLREVIKLNPYNTETWYQKLYTCYNLFNYSNRSQESWQQDMTG